MTASVVNDAPTRAAARRTDDAAPTVPGRIRRLVRSKPDDAAWVRPALLTLLIATGLLYLLDLGASGWANSFYSAAAQAGAHSWKAFFFGSSDAANSITVDKPPAALWIVDLSARLFGVNSWSILVPEALMGVATVGVLYATVKRWFGAPAGLIAGVTLAVTPVAALMFRFNNPDALLVLLLTGSFYAMTRALEGVRTTRWLVFAATLVGTAFLTKMLQAFLVVPAMAVVFLACGSSTVKRRFVQLVYAGLALAVAGGWWMVAVSLTPAADRPYIGGSQNNSIWNLLFGYNGFGRLTGSESGSVGGGTGGGGWGTTGLTRLFGSEMGSQISWLLPTAITLLVGGLWLTRRSMRTDRSRAALALWGGWLVVTAATFSFGQGIIHPYYTLALAPAISALVGIGGVLVWRARSTVAGRLFLGVAMAFASTWAYVLLSRTPSFLPWLRWPVLVIGLLAALALSVPLGLGRRLTVVALVAGLLAGIAGPTAYAVQTASVAHSGAIPSAGPTSGGGMGGGGGGGRPGGAGGFGGGRQGQPGTTGGAAPTAPSGTAPTGTGTQAGGFGGGTARRTGGMGGTGGGGTGGGAGGGLLSVTTPNATLTAALKAGNYTWAAATIGSDNASGYQLASGKSVMPIGGFNGTDPSPTLAAFEADVAAGKIHYFIPGSTSVGGGGGSTSTTTTASAITAWVESHYKTVSLGGTTVYDLTSPVS